MIASSLVIAIYPSAESIIRYGALDAVTDESQPGSCFEVISFFAVLRKVQALHFVFLRDTQPDERVDKLEQNQTPHNGQSPGNYNSDNLIQDLVRVSIEQPNRQRVSLAILKNWIDDFQSKNSGEHGAQSAAGSVDTERVQRIIIKEPGLYFGNHQEAYDSGDETNRDRGNWTDKSSRRRDRDKSSHGSGNCSESAWLAVANPFRDHPAESGCSGCEMSGRECAAGKRSRGKRATGVESEPPHPQQAGADKTEDHAMRRHRLARIAQTLAEIDRADQRGDSRSDMHDGAAGEIKCGKSAAERCVEQSAFAPNHMGLFIERAGGVNLGSRFISGWSGTLNPEQVIASNPDLIITTGSNWKNSRPEGGFVTLGYNTPLQQSQSELRALMERNAGWSNLQAVESGRSHAIWHQFYISPYHFVTMLEFAKWLYPQDFANVDVEAIYRDFHTRFLPIQGYSGTFWASIK